MKANIIWFACTAATVILWSTTCLLYKAGIHKEKEDNTCLKYSASIGIIFFIIALIYLSIRDEPFTIWESAIRYWPMTLFGIVYAIINTISFNGFVYNEVTVESPVEGISGGTSVILLILAYVIMGRVDSILTLLTPLRTFGIIIILISIILLSAIRNKEARRDENLELSDKRSFWKHIGLGTLIFPIMYAVVDGLETIITGICLDTTYGYAMPEGDSIIIIGMEYAIFALGCWIYIFWKERKIYNPFKRINTPRILGAVTDNIGIVFYSYAMAIDSVSTDPILAVYPVFVMIGGHMIMKEKVSIKQYICLLSIIAGSVLIIVDALN
jgi:uncharacterized membrane protein